jgi:hypothetical protein
MGPPACDRWSRRKEKCLFADGAFACRRCIESDARCCFQRRQPRRGRRPVARSLPFGHSQVFSIEPTPTWTPDQSSSEASPVSHAASAGPLAAAAWTSPLSNGISPVSTTKTANHHDLDVVPPNIPSAVPHGLPPQHVRVFTMLRDPKTFGAFHCRFMI